MVKETIVVAIPPDAVAGQSDTHWWRVANGEIVDRGADSRWLEWIASARLLALAPVAEVRLEIAAKQTDAATPRQAASVARVRAIDASIATSETLHAVSAGTEDGEGNWTAVVANSVMLEWIDWAAEYGADPDAIVPVAALIPCSAEWLAASIGAEHIVARSGVALPNEPSLAAVLVDQDDVRDLSPDEIDAAIVATAADPILNLRTGAFAKRRRWVVDQSRVRELVLLAGMIPLVGLLWALVSIAKLEQSTSRLNGETLRLAEQMVGRPVTLDNVETELTQSIGSLGSIGLSPSLAALYQGLQAETGINSTQITYGNGGTLSTTLAAPSVAEINRVLLALQRDNYVVTAVPRQAPDGRAMVDVTIRTGL